MSWFSQAWDHTVGNKGAAGFLFGHGPQAVVPKDMQGLRQQNIDLLMSFLKPGAFGPGGKGNQFFFGNQGNYDDFMGKNSPEMQAYNSTRGVLEGMMTGTGPQFERDLSMANSQGGRFGSANAILRGEALRNLFNQRSQTAQTLGTLAGQAGNRTFQAQNQQLQLLASLFGMSNQATNFPVENDRGAFGDILKIGASFAGGGGFGGGASRTAKLPSAMPQNPFGGMNFG